MIIRNPRNPSSQTGDPGPELGGTRTPVSGITLVFSCRLCFVCLFSVSFCTKNRSPRCLESRFSKTQL